MAINKFKIKNGLDLDNTDLKNIGTLQGGGENLTVSELDEIVNATASGSSETLERADSNIMLNAFRIASNNALTVFQMIDSIVDEFVDESGIDNVASINEDYIAEYYTPGNDANLKLLLNLNGSDGATSTTDASPSAHSPITFSDNAQLDTAEKKFGSASLLLDGNGDKLTIGDSSDFDIFATNTENWTVDFWFKGTTPLDNRHTFISHFEDGSNYWQIATDISANTVQVRIQKTSGIFFSGTTNVQDDAWHHICLVKKGTDLGLYIDGNQEGFGTLSFNVDFTGNLYVGTRDGSNSFAKGHLDDIRIQKSNFFNASPNVGLTDTINIPTTESTLLGTMELISESFTAETEPNTARITMLLEEVGAFTLSTDLEVSISKDGGSTFDIVTIEDIGLFDSNKKILAGMVTLTSTGTTMKYKIKTFNGTDVKIHAVGLSWD